MTKNNRARINRPPLNHVHLQTIRSISYLFPSPAVFFPVSFRIQRDERLINSNPPLNAQSSAFFRSAGFRLHGAAGNFWVIESVTSSRCYRSADFDSTSSPCGVSCQRPNPFRRDNFPEGWIRADRIRCDRGEHRLRQREGKGGSRRRAKA